jgi:hypothetical protein
MYNIRKIIVCFLVIANVFSLHCVCVCVCARARACVRERERAFSMSKIYNVDDYLKTSLKHFVKQSVVFPPWPLRTLF